MPAHAVNLRKGQDEAWDGGIEPGIEPGVDV
jgi:hypothetical protein